VRKHATLIPSFGGISKLFWSICTLLIDGSNFDQQCSSADSGFVFYLLSIKADEERQNNLGQGITRYFGIVCDELSHVAKAGQDS
jgi:hypothetical protein